MLAKVSLFCKHLPLYSDFFFKSENWKKTVVLFLLNIKAKQHWLYKFSVFCIISTIIHKNTQFRIEESPIPQNKLYRKIWEYFKEDAVLCRSISTYGDREQARKEKIIRTSSRKVHIGYDHMIRLGWSDFSFFCGILRRSR